VSSPTRRHLPFEALLNLRDLGGYPIAGGGMTRWGQVFRSDSLHHLQPHEVEAFQAIGIEVVYDLRRPAEVEEAPGPLPFVHLHLASRTLQEMGGRLETAADAEQWLHEDYCGMFDNGAATYARLFADLAAADAPPAVFHCWGGKDRTGTMAALLLTLLGVERDTVLDDYELTSNHRGPHHVDGTIELFMGVGMTRDAAVAVLGTPRWAMADALARLEREHGSVERYVTEEGGLAEGAVEALRARLVVAG
jgi:protein-tyrosine phosphatase